MAIPALFGSEFRVNTATQGDQAHASVAALAGGKFIVVWDDRSNGLSTDVKGQIYNADGTKYGGETSIAGDAFGFYWDQQRPVVTGTADGRFALAWEDRFVPSASNIFGQVFNPDWSSPAGNYATAFAVNTDSGIAHTQPAIAAAQGGRFLVGYTHAYSATDNDVYGRAYNAAASFTAAAFAMDLTAANESETAIASLTNGNYVSVWTDSGAANHTDGSGTHIRMRIFAGTGAPVSATDGLIVNYQSSGDQTDPAVAGLSNGNFVVVWTDFSGGFNATRDIRVRLFYPNGTPVGNFPPSGYPAGTSADEYQASVAATATGYVIAWVDSGTGVGGGTDGSGAHIRAQFYNNDGTLAGEQFVANTVVKNGSQSDPHVAVLADGRVVITWTDPGLNPAQGDTSGTSIRAQIYDPRVAAVDLAGGALNDDYVGTPFDDTLVGAGGNDTMAGGAGDDTLGGGDGNDLLRGGPGTDQIYGNAGNDTLDGGAGADLLTGGIDDDTYIVEAGDLIVELPGEGNDSVRSSTGFSLAAFPNVENLTLLGSGNFDATGNGLANILTGNAGNNILTGNAGNDTLNGGAGADTMIGGEGNDTYVNPVLTGAGADTIVEDAAGGTADLIQSNASLSLANAPNVERLTLTGNGNLNGTGNDLANVITGNGGANTLNGGSGADTLSGGGGKDILIGGKGNDVMNGGAAADTFRFAASNTGKDTINGFETALDRFDLSGGAFSNRVEAGGDTTLTHAGGTILMKGVTGLTLPQWNLLVLPAGGAARAGEATFPSHDAAGLAAGHGDFLPGLGALDLTAHPFAAAGHADFL